MLCNEGYRRLFPRSADLRVPGARLRDVWLEEVRRGVYKGVDAGNADAWMEEHHRRRRASGDEVPEEIELGDGAWLQVRATRTGEGGTIVVARDISERKRREREAEHQALHDPLTDLPNRRLFLRELARAHARVARDGGRLAVFLVDLDGFKAVNDRHGHAAGDGLLVELARRLRACTRGGDLAARLGGDEFGLLSKAALDGGDGGSFESLAGRLVASLGAPAHLQGLRIRPGASVGLTVFPDDPCAPEELLGHADEALYAAKAAGRGAWRAWSPPRGQGRRRPIQGVRRALTPAAPAPG